MTNIVIHKVLSPHHTKPSYRLRTEGKKHYELSSHLGNVQVVLTDKRLPVCNESSGITESYMAEVISAYDYYPFGAPIQDRTYEFEMNKYGFNGQEKDNEINGSGNTYVFKFRIHDARLGRFLSVDPLSDEYPWNSTYAFAESSPVAFADLEGLERYYAADGKFLGLIGTSDEIRIANSDFVWKVGSSISMHAQGKEINYLLKNSKKLTESSNATQSAVMTLIYFTIVDAANISLEKGYKLHQGRVLARGKGSTMRGENGLLIGTGHTAVSRYDKETDKALISINNIPNNYYDLLKLIEHENEHILISTERGVHINGGADSREGFDEHFNIEWKVYSKYKDDITERSKLDSKEFLNLFLDNMEAVLKTINKEIEGAETPKAKNKLKREYNRKNAIFRKKEAKFKKEFGNNARDDG